MAVIAELKNVSFQYDEDKPKVLNNLSLSLETGSFNILVGPGGSGKSTLCHLFNGRIPHLIDGILEGTILVEGRSTADMEMKDISCSVGSVFQDPESMFATLSVEDEIAFGPENLLFNREEILESVESLLNLTGITPYRHNLVWNLSGGQIQKLGLAAVLAMKPRLIILDEPTANLDPSATRGVHELILKLRGEGITILLVTRELDDFMAQADNVIVLDKGSLVASGEPYSLLMTQGIRMEQLGIWLPETVEIGLALIKAGYKPDQIPITVDETLKVLDKYKLCPEGRVLEGQEKAYHRQTGNPLIKADNVRFSYGKGIYAIKGISLEVYPGEMLAIVGRNGAGKSTMARLLIGLNKCTEGNLELFGKNSRRWKVPDLSNHISLVFQNPEHQFLTDTVAQEIEYSFQAQGVFDTKILEKERDRILAMLNLEHEKENHPFALSAGNKRRLGVATMLVGDPKVLIVDEPTYGQDKKMTGTLMKLMKDIQARGIAVIMISHDMRLVEEFADRVMVFSEGQKHFDGIPTELFNKADILEKASLQPTLLFQLLKKLGERNVIFKGHITGSDSFTELLLGEGEAS